MERSTWLTLVLWHSIGLDKIMKNFLKYFLILALFLPNISNAGSLFFGKNLDKIDIGQEIGISLYVDTQDETINTVSTKIIYPNDILSLEMIEDNTSVINFWIENNDDKNGTITLSGLTPGGYLGDGGEIATIKFIAKKSGNGKIYTKDTEVFLNDGLGSKSLTSDTSFNIFVTENIFNQTNGKLADFVQPESFNPEISRSETFLDNKWFVVFSTKDKDSGISHYAVKESRFKTLLPFVSWKESKSPYLLKDQSRKGYVAIQAVDFAGNTRVEIVKPETPNIFGEIMIYVVLIFVLWLLFSVVSKIMRRILRKRFENNIHG